MSDLINGVDFVGKTLIFSTQSHGSTIVVIATVVWAFNGSGRDRLFVRDLLPESPVTCVVYWPGEGLSFRSDGVPCTVLVPDETSTIERIIEDLRIRSPKPKIPDLPHNDWRPRNPAFEIFDRRQ